MAVARAAAMMALVKRVAAAPVAMTVVRRVEAVKVAVVRAAVKAEALGVQTVAAMPQ